MSQIKLPSWHPGTTRDAIEVFLDAAEMLPIEQRVAVFDIDGTLWCERPQYSMVGFLVTELRHAVADKPELSDRPEYRAALDWDRKAIGQLGLMNVLLALVEPHAGITPEAYQARVRAYVATARHPDRDVPLSRTRYRPMLELIAELRARHFSVYVVTGSGTEFTRAISDELFGVKPEGVVGTQVGYELVHVDGRPQLVRTKELFGDPNEGPAKITSIQRLLGRRPILAAGNSAGDSEMLEYAQAFDGPSLALLVDHDDAEREYAYQSVAGTFASSEPITTIALRRGWTVVSMRDDWSTVFADS
jgi:phosphoserine phosphatase